MMKVKKRVEKDVPKGVCGLIWASSSHLYTRIETARNIDQCSRSLDPHLNSGAPDHIAHVVFLTTLKRCLCWCMLKSFGVELT